MLPVLLLGGAAGLAWASRGYQATPWDAAFRAAGDRWGVPHNLLRAIARHESGLNATAVHRNQNGSTDWGLMQLNDATLRRFSLSSTDALVPEKAIPAAAQLLATIKRELGERFSTFSWPAAYNVGSDLVPVSGFDYARHVVWHWLLYDVSETLGRA